MLRKPTGDFGERNQYLTTEFLTNAKQENALNIRELPIVLLVPRIRSLSTRFFWVHEIELNLLLEALAWMTT